MIQRLPLALATVALLSAASAKTTITFWHTYNSDSNENKTLMEQVIPAFEKANPDITVEAQAIPYPDFRQKILTSLAGGTAPDVARIDIIWSPEFAKLGALEKLDGKPGFSALKGAVFPGPLSTNAYNGSYYGLPLDTNTQIMLYNADLLKAAGVGAPKTMNEVQGYLNKLQKKQGGKVTQWGLAFSGPSNWVLLPWIWSNGGQVLDPSMTRATGYLNGPKTVAAINMLLAWSKAGLIAPTMAGGGLGTWDGMGTLKYAGIQDGPWAYPALKAQYPKLNVEHALFPSGSGGSVSVVGGENIVMFGGSKNKDAAWKFMQFMLSMPTQITMASTGQIPVLSAAEQNPAIKNHPYYGLYFQQLRTAKARPPVPVYARIEDTMQGALQDIFAGKRGTQAALDDAAKKVDALLK